MTKIPVLAAVIAALLTAAPGAAEVLGGDAAACHPDAPGPAVLVHVHGFKDRAGRLRVQYYSDKANEYLVTGKYLHRVEVPVTAAGDMTVCVTLGAPGRFAFVALHDRNSDGKLSIWSDGIGFSNNPHLGLAKPKAAATAHDFGGGVTTIAITLNYLNGFSVRPIAP